MSTADADLHELFRQLDRHGLRATSGARLRLVVTPTPFEPGLTGLDLECRRTGRPWLLISADPARPWVGPLFGNPGVCLGCFLGRLRLNGQTSAGPPAGASAAELFRVAAREAAGWIRTGQTRLAGAFLSMDKLDGQRRHRVVPACAACTAGGGVALKPGDLASPLVGLVESVDVDSVEGRFFRARARLSQDGFPGEAGGKGLTEAAATASCLAEAVERASLFRHGGETLIQGSYDLLRDRAIDPRSLDLFSAGQHARRAWWVRRHGSFHWPGMPFRPDVPVEWVETRSALTGSRRLVPAEYCFFDYPGRFLHADSNGCAAGGAFDEAARNALLELAERDAVAIWWYNRIPRPALDRRALGSRRIARLAETLDVWRRSFWLLDVTNDLAIPVVVAVSCDQRGGRIALGSGAGLRPEEAAWRALAEMCAHISDLRGRRPGPDADANERALWSWWREARLTAHPYLRPAGEVRAPKSFAGSAASEFQEASRRFGEAGHDVFLYDHSHPGLPLRVVRAIAPGLRSWWATFAPGRLYEVPVALGWRARPLAERGLNPVPYFL